MSDLLKVGARKHIKIAQIYILELSTSQFDILFKFPTLKNFGKDYSKKGIQKKEFS